MLNLDQLRADFPTLNRRINNQSLAYLDNAATTQKPRQVIEAVNRYYRQHNANVHRAAHTLSSEATQQFENARQRVADFLGTNTAAEVIWTRGTTEAINLVAQSYGRSQLKPDDEIIVSELEHHANIVPWQLLAQQTGAKLQIIPILPETGTLDMAKFHQLLGDKTRIVAVGHASNALGTINPVKEICQAAKAVGAISLVDGAQSSAHLAIDVNDIGCDFFAFSGHKVFAPTGIGALWGRMELLEQMPPWQAGGEMIERVSFQHTTFNQPPFKFEAGTPNISGAIGLATALDYLQSLDHQAITSHEQQLLHAALEGCSSIKGFQLVGQSTERVSLISFTLTGQHQQDIGMLLDQQGIAVRIGHHCAMPLMQALNLPGTVRASFAFYNNQQEVDRFVTALDEIQQAPMVASSELENSAASSTEAQNALDPFSSSPYGCEITAETLLTQLTAHNSWNNRYRDIMLLGKSLPAIPDRFKTAQHRINGCESDAWLSHRLNEQGQIQLLADSDARIIRGLLALTLAAFNNKTASEILSIDIDSYFKQLGLLKHLSPSRGNGLRAIIDRIRAIATAQQSSDGNLDP